METLIGTGPAGAQGGAPAGDLIKDVDTESFAADVLDASMSAPVIVDFWATWCGPCKTLGPALEKAVKEARGAVKLVKIDVDRNQELAAQMRIQSIPAVYAFFQGRPVDGFVGVQPDSQVQAFVKRLTELGGGGQGPSPIDQALAEAKALLESDQAPAAAALFAQVLQHEPDNTAALAGLMRCKLALGDTAGARAIFESLAEELRGKAEFEPIAASLELAEAGSAAGPIPELMEKVARDHNDHQARFDLAMALYANGKREAAVDELLEIMRRKRDWNEDAARKQLLKFFEAWGPTDPLTLSARRQLSSLLFS